MSDELQNLATKIEELKNASMLNAKTYGDATLTQLLRVLMEIDLRLNAIEGKMGP